MSESFAPTTSVIKLLLSLNGTEFMKAYRQITMIAIMTLLLQTANERSEKSLKTVFVPFRSLCCGWAFVAGAILAVRMRSEVSESD